MIGLPRKRDGKGILPSFDIQRFRFWQFTLHKMQDRNKYS